MPRGRRTSSRRTSTSKQAKFWASVIALAVLYIMQQQGKPLTQTGEVEDGAMFQQVSVASVYDGDTFKVYLACKYSIFCKAIPVRVRGVDTPEIKGTAREKKLAQMAKEFTQAFLDQKPITLTDCGRDKYFRLLCDVTNADGEDLATELIRRELGDPYNGGTKSKRFQ